MHAVFTASALTILQTGTELVTDIPFVNPGVCLINGFVLAPSSAIGEKPNWGDWIELFVDDNGTLTSVSTMGACVDKLMRIQFDAPVALDGGAGQTMKAQYHNVLKAGNTVKGVLNLDCRQVG